MQICQSCGKGKQVQSFSRHQRGSSGGSGTWALRAQITTKIQRPNLHKYQGMKLCSKCLKTLKKNLNPQVVPAVEVAAVVG